jgi:histidinol dehydrogenase
VVRVLRLANLKEDELTKLKRRSETNIAEALAVAQQVIDQIQQRGDEALIEYVRKFDCPTATLESLKVTEAEFVAAHQSIDPAIQAAIHHAHQNIRAVHERQMPEQIHMAEIEPGVFAGEKVSAIDSAGLYVPRGKGAFPSVMLMLAVPATVAKVKRVMVCTPPDREGNVEPASLVAAQLAGVKDVYKLGGIQAITAMALGTTTVPKVSKITGPCNAYGSAAKRILFGKVDVGLPAGPSESVILADEHTNPHIAAMDLLIEAEHGPDSAALLVTHSVELAAQVEKLLPQYLQDLPTWRREFCETGLANYGGILLTDSLEASIQFVNDYAPEHLEVLIKDPWSVVGSLEHVGEILLGENTPITLGNYCIGVNAILPTGSFAKSYSAVSVHDFLKRSGIGYVTRAGFDRLKDTAYTLADYEGFPAHAQAVKKRLEFLGSTTTHFR